MHRMSRALTCVHVRTTVAGELRAGQGDPGSTEWCHVWILPEQGLASKVFAHSRDGFCTIHRRVGLERHSRRLGVIAAAGCHFRYERPSGPGELCIPGPPRYCRNGNLHSRPLHSRPCLILLRPHHAFFSYTYASPSPVLLRPCGTFLLAPGCHLVVPYFGVYVAIESSRHNNGVPDGICVHQCHFRPDSNRFRLVYTRFIRAVQKSG